MDLPAQSGTQPPSAAVDVQAHSAGRQHGLGADKYRKTSSLAPRRKDQECRPRNDGEKRAPGKPYRQHSPERAWAFLVFRSPLFTPPDSQSPRLARVPAIATQNLSSRAKSRDLPFLFLPITRLPNYSITQSPEGGPPIRSHSSQFGVDFSDSSDQC